jgi:hypothetical protein
MEENAMAADTLEAKAHELIGQLDPGKLAAVVHLLEVMVHESEEPVGEEDRRRYREGQAFFDSGKGIPMKDVLADFGLKLEDFPPHK